MKINSAYLESSLGKLQGLRFILVYGQEEGQIRLVSQKLQKLFLKDGDIDFNLVCFNFKQVRDDIALLKNEMASVSLLGGDKVIVIEDCPATVAKDILETIKKPIGKAKIIMVSDDLKPTSNLRKLFEAEDSCAAIACYKDDPGQMTKFIGQYLSKLGVTYEPAVPSALANLLPANRLLVTNELEKLVTYCYQEKITLDDAAKVIAGGKELLLDDLCFALFKQNKQAIIKLLSTVVAEETNFVLIIRTLLKYAMRLLEIKNHMNNGATAEKAVDSIKPPVFFRQKDNLIAVAKTISLEKVDWWVKKLLQLELECKSGKFNPQQIIYNFIVQEAA
jgi:DNA polymerase-3 subunit delta